MKANVKQLPLSLVYATLAGETVMGLEVAPSLVSQINDSILAHYPGVEIKQVKLEIPAGRKEYIAYLQLLPDIRSLRTAYEFEDHLQRSFTEPMGGLIASIVDRGDDLQASIRFSLEQVSARRRRRARKVAAIAAGWLGKRWPIVADRLASRANGSWGQRLSVWPYWFFRKGSVASDSDRKLQDHLYFVTVELRVVASRQQESLAQKRLHGLAAAFAPFTTPGYVTLELTKRPRRSLISAAELAALWHPPVAETQTVAMESPGVPYLQLPADLPDSSKEAGLLPLGQTALKPYRNIGIRPSDRLHQLIIGKSGMGKSVLMGNQIYEDLRQGRGVGLIDPHGDLVSDVLKTIPRHRANDVIVLNPNDPDSARVNTLACSDLSKRALVADNNLASISKVFGFDEKSAPRLIHILRYTLLALVGTKEGSFMAIQPMLLDKKFRKRIVDKVEDPVVRSFWRDELENWSDKYKQEAFPAILNKTGQFIANENLRRFFGDPLGDLDLRQMMDEGKIILCNLSKGSIGEPAARFCGSMLMTYFQNVVMTRSDKQLHDRRPFYLYADEYATFVNPSFEETLSEARKYGLYLTAAQQNCSQVDKVGESIMDAMFTNVWNLISFQVANKDAQRLAAEFAGQVRAEDLVSTPKYHAVVRSAINGVPTRPFIVKTHPPVVPNKEHANPEVILKRLARRFGRNKQFSQTKISS